MTNDTDKKRQPANDAPTTQRSDNMTSGQILRQAREQKKLSLQDVSAAIHVRAAQLKAIEEGDIDALPGMTYATGFVKSYAGYLKLNALELSNKFKAEHGAIKPVMQDLPEIKPVVESRMPDPMLVGVAAFAAIVLLLGWTFFGGADEETVDIATAPPVAAESVQAADLADAGAATAPAVMTESEPAAAPVAEDVVTAKDAPAETPPATEVTDAVKAADAPAAETASADAAAPAAPAEEAVPVRKPEIAAVEEAPPEAETINIKKPGGRVVFRARNPSWVQISDANERVVYKRLMRPGEQYTVPEGRGYTLITTNAGGVEVLVDGKRAPSLGKSGEILRGLPLEPAELIKEKRIKSRINN